MIKKKSQITQRDGELYHVLGLEESLFWKWLYYPNQATDSVQSLSNYQWSSLIPIPKISIDRIRTKNFTIHTQIPTTTNSQDNLEKEKRSWRNQAPRLQNTQQSYSNQDSMILTEKEKHTSMKQDRKFRHKCEPLWTSCLR